MSDHQQGPGWWLASDGKWYPPSAPPPGAPDLTPAGIAARKQEAQNGCGVGCGAVVLVVVVLVLLGALFGSDDEEGASGEDLRFGAFDVCQQFVEERLRAPATAEYPNFFEDDGEVVVTNSGDTYTVRSSVDSENGFGALLTTPFTCVVRHTSGDVFRLVRLDMRP